MPKVFQSLFIKINSNHAKIPRTPQKLLPHWKPSSICLPLRINQWTRPWPSIDPTYPSNLNRQWPQWNDWYCPNIKYWGPQKSFQEVNKWTSELSHSVALKALRSTWENCWFIRPGPFQAKTTGLDFGHTGPANEREIFWIQNFVWGFLQIDTFEKEINEHENFTMEKERKGKWEEDWCEPGNWKETSHLWWGNAWAVGKGRPKEDQKTGHQSQDQTMIIVTSIDFKLWIVIFDLRFQTFVSIPLNWLEIKYFYQSKSFL